MIRVSFKLTRTTLARPQARLRGVYIDDRRGFQKYFRLESTWRLSKLSSVRGPQRTVPSFIMRLPPRRLDTLWNAVLDLSRWTLHKSTPSQEPLQVYTRTQAGAYQVCDLIAVAFEAVQPCFPHHVPYDDICVLRPRRQKRPALAVPQGSHCRLVPAEDHLTGALDKVPDPYLHKVSSRRLLSQVSKSHGTRTENCL